MRISIVTISFNQAQFLRECIESVLSQGLQDLEYIIVDPGSTDGSKEIIDSYGDRVIKVYEKDDGPADGLNKGFARATGEIYGFLNSDDVLEVGALKRVIQYFEVLSSVDVISGHSWVINAKGGILRRFYSDHFNLWMYAHRACCLSQASTFFRSSAYHKAGGFNPQNRIAWDGELYVDLAIAGARFTRVNEFWSKFRLHEAGITGSGAFHRQMAENNMYIFKKIIGRDQGLFDRATIFLAQYARKCIYSRDTIERLFYGPIGPRPAKRDLYFRRG